MISCAAARSSLSRCSRASWLLFLLGSAATATGAGSGLTTGATTASGCTSTLVLLPTMSNSRGICPSLATVSVSSGGCRVSSPSNLRIDSSSSSKGAAFCVCFGVSIGVLKVAVDGDLAEDSPVRGRSGNSPAPLDESPGLPPPLPPPGQSAKQTAAPSYRGSPAGPDGDQDLRPVPVPRCRPARFPPGHGARNSRP